MLLVLGILAGVYLLLHKGERENEAVCCAEVEQIPLRRRARLFFSVPMTLFVLWCVANMLVLILMSFAM